MLALPPAPAPAPRRQLLVGTAFAGAATAMFFGGMLAVWLRFRNAAPLKTASNGDLIKDWIPKGVEVHQVAANLMLMTMVSACVMVQMSVYAAKRDDKVHAGLGFGIAALMALAVVNAQAFMYGQMGVPIRDGLYHSMFYAVTGSWMLLVIALLVATAVTAFRYLGGRTRDREVVASLALFWYVSTAIYFAVWFVVYVTK
jgi:heme/copper-type cytochrome/quinol oxidase subunit 3